MCIKKYCECYHAGVKCTDLCKCEGCKNGNCQSGHNSESENEEMYNEFDEFYLERMAKNKNKRIKKDSIDSGVNTAIVE